jgi:hypothetical protein
MPRAKVRRSFFESKKLLPESYFDAVNSDGANELTPDALA